MSDSLPQQSYSIGLCTFSPAPLSLYTKDCNSDSDFVSLIKFADDTTLISLISNNDESTYCEGVMV